MPLFSKSNTCFCLSCPAVVSFSLCPCHFLSSLFSFLLMLCSLHPSLLLFRNSVICFYFEPKSREIRKPPPCLSLDISCAHIREARIKGQKIKQRCIMGKWPSGHVIWQELYEAVSKITPYIREDNKPSLSHIGWLNRMPWHYDVVHNVVPIFNVKNHLVKNHLGRCLCKPKQEQIKPLQRNEVLLWCWMLWLPKLLLLKLLDGGGRRDCWTKRIHTTEVTTMRHGNRWKQH